RRIKEEMEDDVRMAGELQKKFFPSSYPEFPKGVPPEEQNIEFLHCFELCRDVGGDYCAVTQISDHEAGIFLCDVSGIGVRAALVTALIRGIMQEIVPLAGEPGAYLSRMNTTLISLLRQEDLRLDVQACYLIIDISTGRIRLANAGHSVPIRFCGDRKAEWLCSADAALSAPLAVQEGTVYNTITQTIDPGDTVILYTDGLYTVVNNLDDPFGEKRLIESAHSFAGEPLDEIFDGLKNDALAFAKSGQFTDDVCLVGFRLKRLMSS
ncbi:MAG TPA: PP2C family protein-serine/threonine phosphatase, partial [Pontiella sp.]